MEWLISLLTLTVLEIVLGIDNIIFITILTDKLPKADRLRIQRIGLILAPVFSLFPYILALNTLELLR
ncbi:MAG: TerC family protein, partial [Bacteroidota bacterium]